MAIFLVGILVGNKKEASIDASNLLILMVHPGRFELPTS